MLEPVLGVENPSDNKAVQNPWLRGVSAFWRGAKTFSLQGHVTHILDSSGHSFYFNYRPYIAAGSQSWATEQQTAVCGSVKKLHLQALKFEFHKVSIYYRMFF